MLTPSLESENALPGPSVPSSHSPQSTPGLGLLRWLFHPAQEPLARRIVRQLSNRDQLSLAATCHSLRCLVEFVYRLDVSLDYLTSDDEFPGLSRVIKHRGDTIRSLRANIYDYPEYATFQNDWKRVVGLAPRLDSISLSGGTIDDWPRIARSLTDFPRTPRSLNLDFTFATFFDDDDYIASLINDGMPDLTCHQLGGIRSLYLITNSQTNTAEILAIISPLLPGLRRLEITTDIPDPHLYRELVTQFPRVTHLSISPIKCDCSILFPPNQPIFRNLVCLELRCVYEHSSLGALASLKATD
ncbi:hypothetical protein BJ085DRAFT_39074 [Dimargaris cristalligena]|uniref:F-box domain-containing protein n=1 Tax=Dimargaris cristalligena TaxID=215637 RepID=A0A4P9ZLE3_9FUNG|nr:hypothetical protein BJ085DRAFT_39074 [Dimargaris cristalligena]|eukprot:RKP33935.1 hypothetical protein BJ085DRAFT_39074 [Dimargaris cristalligena]